MLRGQTQSLSAQKNYISIIFWHGQKSLFHFSHRNYGIRFFLMFCARDKNVIIYWRTMGEMTFALFSNFTSRAVFWKSRLEVVHRLSFLGATSMLSGRSQVQVSYGYNNKYQLHQRIHRQLRRLMIFNISSSSTSINFINVSIDILDVSWSSTYHHLPWTSSIER